MTDIEKQEKQEKVLKIVSAYEKQVEHEITRCAITILDLKKRDDFRVKEHTIWKEITTDPVYHYYLYNTWYASLKSSQTIDRLRSEFPLKIIKTKQD
jgi:hypothetical protein